MASEAVNMQESMMPATVKVPPMMAQIWEETGSGSYTMATPLTHPCLTHCLRGGVTF